MEVAKYLGRETSMAEFFLFGPDVFRCKDLKEAL